MSDDDFNSKAPEEMKPTPKRGVSKRKSELADSATKKKSKSDASSGRSRSSLSSQLQIDMIGNQLFDDVLKSPTRLTRRSSAKASNPPAQSPPVTKATTKNQKTSAAQSPLPPISQIAPLTTSIPAPAPAPAPVFVVTPTQPSVSQPVAPQESTKSCTFATTGKSFVKQVSAHKEKKNIKLKYFFLIARNGMTAIPVVWLVTTVMLSKRVCVQAARLGQFV
jgi:hypothetical protein